MDYITDLKLNLIFLTLFLFIFGKINCQIDFKGSVLDENNVPLNRARIFIKTKNISKYTFTDSKGLFHIQFDAILDENVTAIASSTNYDNDTINITLDKNKFQYTSSFFLQKSSKKIDEVIIKGKRQPIEIKKDTVVYNPENFIDGSERNVEDLLKKLPGIKVNESGSIEFKGKTVVAVMLDGGNLFNSNYTIGTKSIDPKIIDQVQAIENWSENPILKSLNAEDKVALNLKLKKDKVSFSTSLNAETDFHKRINAGGYVMLINSLIKTFATSNYNNIGENKSPVNLSTNSFSLEDYQNLKYQTQGLISTNSINTQFGTEKANRNQQWFNSSNSIIKLNDKANLKIIGNSTTDKILINNVSENYYQLNNKTIITRDENGIVKKPNYYSGSLDFKWSKSDKEYLEISNSINYLSENIENNLVANYENNFHTNVENKNLFSKNEGVYTRKIDKKNALQIKTLYTFSKRPQNLLISPSSLAFSTSNDTTNLQNILLTKQNIELGISLYHVFSENQKLIINTGFDKKKFSLNSKLFTDNENITENFQNDLIYNTNTYYMDVDYKFENKIWNIDFNQNNQIFRQKLSNKDYVEKRLFINRTELTILKTLFEKTSILFSGKLETIPIDERYLFKNNILISNRNILRNDVSLDYEIHENYNIGLIFNDTFLSQFKATLIGGYSKNKNKLIPEYTVNSNLNFTQYNRIEKPIQSYNTTLNLEKYFPLISSRFNLKTSYFHSEYYSSINSNELTKINSNTFQINLIHQFAFNFPLKIRNIFDYVSIENKSKVTEKNKNESFTIKNDFTYSFKNKILVFNLNSEYFIPNFKQKNSLFFLNFGFSYNPKESKFNYFLSFKNITNQKYIFTQSIHDYSTFYNKLDLIPRLFLVGAKLNL